ncbi:hypothetical protein TNIN_158181 [Trichonephila inaurata madagascariensis]|uniref:Uncharacterized protein n=1 Tax=Trichonephila inaurata madagascariensis TaxID=2747483 RepID=A0A8X6WPU6_9ARAC|nr:hypothetical protein TNIN_158181 [Trichonephila inaurata madagascariensis]
MLPNLCLFFVNGRSGSVLKCCVLPKDEEYKRCLRKRKCLFCKGEGGGTEIATWTPYEMPEVPDACGFLEERKRSINIYITTVGPIYFFKTSPRHAGRGKASVFVLTSFIQRFRKMFVTICQF